MIGDNKITDIGNLVFFTEKGYEIPMEKVYTIQWEIIPNMQIANNFISNPKGHFMFELEDKVILTEIDDPGKVIVCNTTVTCNNGAGETPIVFELSTIDDIVLFYKEYQVQRVKGRYYDRDKGEYAAVIDNIDEYVYNSVKITFSTLTETIEREYPINLIFDTLKSESETSIDANNDTLLVYNKLTELTVAPLDYEGESTTFINKLIESNFKYEDIFPCVRYMGTVTQDKVSTDFVAANTIIILEDQGNDVYKRPAFGKSNYKLHFEFQKDSEMRFISSDSVANIIWNTSYTVDTDSQVVGVEQTSVNYDTPIYFSVGFQAEVEGCYQNIMAMYIKVNDIKYIVGLVTFLTTVEGEDERYRALLGNMGIPDPKTYPNIFKSQDPMEQGVDWTIVNEKSKELMLSYDNIFPYVGTYKALLGAVKFLGYHDLIFKEWYKIKDQNGKDKFITLQTYDIQTGKALKSKLKEYGVDFGEFERYKKLNRLTMIYHLNEIDEESGETLDVWTNRTDTGSNVTTTPDNGLYKAINPTTHQAVYGDTVTLKSSQYMQLPVTYKIYEYRTDEILAKLYSVKAWLEKYILGVNCYITDICGEGVVVERFKNQAYVTQHHLKDLTTCGKFTPKITEVTDFQNSNATITCSLNEFNSVTIEDYEDFSIESFINGQYQRYNGSTPIGEPIEVSAPFERPVVATEYQFEVINNDVKSGSLAEFDGTKLENNPILIDDNEILFYNNNINTSEIDKDELPIIEIAQGNLRLCYGDWKSNIAFTVNMAIDQNTGKEVYTLFDEQSKTIVYQGQQKVFLYPFIKKDNLDVYKLYWATAEDSDKPQIEFNGDNSTFVYTSDNKWNVPLLIIRNYKCSNKDEVLGGDYILEIINGRLLFRNHKETDDNSANGCEVIFGASNEKEQSISMNYKYLSKREPIYTYNFPTDKVELTYDDLNNSIDIPELPKINVNRLGNYSVSVQAFDGYNNMFVNTSDDITIIKSNPIEIDTILNSDYIVNKPEFYSTNTFGEQLTSDEIKQLLEKTENEPAKYPQSYRIYSIDTDANQYGKIWYDNISYAIDTPKTGDYLIFNNFQKSISSITRGEKSGYNLYFSSDTASLSELQSYVTIGLCFYSNAQKEIIKDIRNLIISSISIKASDKFTYDSTESYINVVLNDDDINFNEKEEYMEDICDYYGDKKFFTNEISAYIYNASELRLNSDLIVCDTDKKQTYVYSDDKPCFGVGDVIKICMCTSLVNHSEYDDSDIDNETTYRIKDIQKVFIGAYKGKTCYTLDGIIDMQKFNNKKFHNISKSKISDDNVIGPVIPKSQYIIKMCLANVGGVQYVLRVNESADEMTYKYNNSTVMKTEVSYEPTPLLINEYIDNTYSAVLFDYDPGILHDIWTNINDIYTENDYLYRYRNFPVTIDKNRVLIMKPNDDQTILNTDIPLKIQWTWSSYLIEDKSNWHTNLDLLGKQTIFKSINPILTIKPTLLGTQTTTLTCWDVYGNKLVNEGSGFVYVNGNKDNIVDVEQSTANMTYKDVYIIGFETMFEPLNVLSVKGGTTTYTLQEQSYGASKNANTESVQIGYKIYYSDGSVKYNTGADITLNTQTGKKSTTNKVKMKFGEASESHKTVVGQLTGTLSFNNTSVYDLVDPVVPISIDIKQYGTSLTNKIYNLSFTVKDFDTERVDELYEFIIRDHITNISYITERTEGEIESVHGDTLQDSYLQIVSYKFMHDLYGNINYIPENKDGRKHIGILQLTVKFYVNGVTEDITTTGYADVYQQ